MTAKYPVRMECPYHDINTSKVNCGSCRDARVHNACHDAFMRVINEKEVTMTKAEEYSKPTPELPSLDEIQRILDIHTYRNQAKAIHSYLEGRNKGTTP